LEEASCSNDGIDADIGRSGSKRNRHLLAPGREADYLARMARNDDDFGFSPPKAPPKHEVGQMLDSLSVGELKERVALLQAEIARLEAAIGAKTAAGAAADAFFRR
jgi:uncharacterized small protein (DUF1192 family)